MIRACPERDFEAGLLPDPIDGRPPAVWLRVREELLRDLWDSLGRRVQIEHIDGSALRITRLDIVRE